MSDLIALAERCEQATGPDEKLERDIARLIYGPVYEGVPRGVPTQNDTLFPRFTASIDAALTLVPEGRSWGAGLSGNPDTDGPWAWCATEQQSRVMDLDYGKAATPALALCAAALRARANEPSKAVKSTTEVQSEPPAHV